MKKNRLIRNIRLISKFTTLQPWKQTIPIHILPNISKRRDNQTIRFVQLIEYKMRNIFLEKSYTKCDKETILRFKNQYWAYLWINSLKFYTTCFYFMPSWELSKYIKDSRKAFDNFANKQKSVWSNVSWYVKVYTLKVYSIHYTLR